MLFLDNLCKVCPGFQKYEKACPDLTACETITPRMLNTSSRRISQSGPLIAELDVLTRQGHNPYGSTVIHGFVRSPSGRDPLVPANKFAALLSILSRTAVRMSGAPYTSGSCNSKMRRILTSPVRMTHGSYPQRITE